MYSRDGIIFIPDKLKLIPKTYENMTYMEVNESSIARIFHIHTIADQYDLAVRLTDRFGNTVTHLVKHIVAYLFVNNPYTTTSNNGFYKLKVEHLNGDNLNVHFQNLHYEIDI